MNRKSEGETIEVELRAKTTPSIISLIKQRAQLISSGKEKDIYYKFHSNPKNFWIARVRKKNNYYYLTYKSSATFGEGSWHEIEIAISKDIASNLHHFFLGNGFVIEVEISKKRSTYKLDNMTINIDEIEQLGKFMEVEIITNKQGIKKAQERINAFLISLDIEKESITKKGYVLLMQEKVAKQTDPQ